MVESNLYDKLSKLKNPFTLILHNSDNEFFRPEDESNLKYIDIPNCKKIYTQNLLIRHPNIFPIPIGIKNNCIDKCTCGQVCCESSKVLNEVLNE